jgi:hypothetical protein
MAASVERRLVPMMAFCEAPFDGTLDGTMAASSSPPPTARGGDAVATRRAMREAVAKELPLTSQRREQAPQQQQRDGAVDGLAIFETIALQ